MNYTGRIVLLYCFVAIARRRKPDKTTEATILASRRFNVTRVRRFDENKTEHQFKTFRAIFY